MSIQNQQDNKKVVIVGAGFGGMNAAKTLAKHPHLQIILLDKRNHHLFQPLLYQVATAALNPADIATPIRSIFANRSSIATYLCQVTAVDFHKRLVFTDAKDFSFDYLILACGAQHSYFGHDEWEEYAPGLKTLEQAREIRRRIFLAFERAELSESKVERAKELCFVIVGGGPTGVEMAGSLGEICHYSLRNDFRKIDPRDSKIILLEAGPRILPSFSEKNAERAAADLTRLGVQIRVDSKVTHINRNGVHIGQEILDSATVLWAAGVKPAKLSRELGMSVDALGRVKINADLSCKNEPQVFVIGDMAHCPDQQGKPLPGVAAVAIQQGRVAAENIIAHINNKSPKKFYYRNKGQMATIGRSKAIMEFGDLKIGGFIAWLGWLLVHIYYLIGFRNRVLVMMQWALSFFSYQRGARIISNKDWQSAKDN